MGHMSSILGLELKEFTASSLTGSFQNFGATLSNPGVKINFLNTSDVDVYITRDGTNNNWRVPAGGVLTWDETSTLSPSRDSEYYLRPGTQLKIKQVTGAGASGAIIAHIVTRSARS